MSKTLLLLKLLRGHEVRNRSLVGRQSVYATLQINQEVEVRSSTIKDGGSEPDFNQLFMLELGPWWKGKEIVIQLFSRNRVMADSFIGGCSCKLGELVRAVGLDESGAEGSIYPGPVDVFASPSTGTPIASTPLSPSSPTPMAMRVDNLAPVPGKVCFQRVSAAEVRQFGELLPVLAGEEGDETYGSKNLSGGTSVSETSAANASSASGSAPSLNASSGLLRSDRPSHSLSGPASAALPVTWLILRHGGGPASLKHYPAPLWHLPAGRVAVYLDFITLPASSIPRVIGGKGVAHARQGAAVSLPSTILPNGWLGMSDNEKLSWAHAHRRERAAPVPQPMGGLVAAVARSILGAGGSGGVNGVPFSAPVYGSGHPASVAAVAAASASSSWPFPWSYFRSWFLLFHSSHMNDRIFYSWYFIMGICILATEAMFTRTKPQQEWRWWGWGGTSEEPFVNTGEIIDPGAMVPFDQRVIAGSEMNAIGGGTAVAAAYYASWMSGYMGGVHLMSIALGILVLKLGWNMLHEQQISQPWRRLDLVLTLLLGAALGAATQMGASGSEATQALSMAALAVTHAYTRATLYQSEVLVGVLNIRRGGRVATLAPPGGPGGLVHAPLVCSHLSATFQWSVASLIESYHVGLAWITGKASRAGSHVTVMHQHQHQLMHHAGHGGAPHSQPHHASAALMTGSAAASAHRGIPGSVQLCLRSAFFLIGQVVSRWLLLPLPAVVRWWLPSLTSSAAVGVAVPLFFLLLLFMLGRDSAALKGKPWLVLFVLNCIALVAASVRFLPPLLGLLCTAIGLTLWQHKWCLLALPMEWALAAAFVPQQVWEDACPEDKQINKQPQPLIVSAHSHPRQPPQLDLHAMHQPQYYQSYPAGDAAVYNPGREGSQ